MRDADEARKMAEGAENAAVETSAKAAMTLLPQDKLAAEEAMESAAKARGRATALSARLHVASVMDGESVLALTPLDPPSEEEPRDSLAAGPAGQKEEQQ